jgi:hypothetical protein
MLFYARAQAAVGRSRMQRALDVPAAMALGVGMCVAQTAAVLAGLRRSTGEFVRTPKRGNAPASARYRSALSRGGAAELALAAWFAWALVEAARKGLWGALPFLALFLAGFAWVGTLALRARTGRRSRAVPERHPDGMNLVGEGTPG